MFFSVPCRQLFLFDQFRGGHEADEAEDGLHGGRVREPPGEDARCGQNDVSWCRNVKLHKFHVKTIISVNCQFPS